MPPLERSPCSALPITDAMLNILREHPRHLEVLELICAAGDKGVRYRNLPVESGLDRSTATRTSGDLVKKRLIKVVEDVHNPGKRNSMRFLMDARVDPSPEITGGAWYHGGKVDADAVAAARRVCLAQVDRLGAATADMVHRGVCREEPRSGYTLELIAGVLRTMALDRALEECRSTGEGEFGAVASGMVCYRRGGAAQGGMMEGVPCGVCTRIDECSPQGVISPATCVYFNKWLQMDF